MFTSVHSRTCRVTGEAGGTLRLGPGWRDRAQPSRLEKSTAKRPKSVNSSMATAHSQAADAERRGQVWRTTTSHRVKGHSLGGPWQPV